MKNPKPAFSRLEIKEGINDCIIISNCSNCDPALLPAALELLDQQHQQKKKTLILSDISQPDYFNEKRYREIADLLHDKKIKRLVGIGEAISKYAGLFNFEKSFYQSTDEFIRNFTRNLFIDEAVLICGTQEFNFEDVLNLLQNRSNSTVLEVNLNALAHNLNYFRSLLQSKTKVLAMVKAFSYGCGLVEVANMLESHHVDYLGVAITDEGVALRKSGITIPIMVMNPECYSFDSIIDYNLEPEIYNLHVLKNFEKVLIQKNVSNFPIHIKLDTGMRRMGFVQEELEMLLEYLKGSNCFHVKSVFSHLAGADEELHDEFTKTQIEQFYQWSDFIQNRINYPVMRHILNSAGIERFQNAQFDMVRLGIGLYGISTIHQGKVHNVSTLKTTILQIKMVPESDTVGYGRNGLLMRNTRIGVIPIGYADGFNRRLGNGRGKVWVNGRLVPVVGNICMDMSMIDLTDVEAQEGDTVIIFGDDYSISDIAKQLETIPYEVLTSVSQRVKRICFQE